MPHFHTVIGAGPLGRATARALVAHGEHVRLVHRRGDAVLSGVEVRAADIHDPAAFEEALLGSTAVYFCAQPAYTRWPQEFGPMLDAVLGACGRLQATLVVADNLYMYGDPAPGEALREDSPVTTTTRKGRVRASMAERVLHAHQLGWLPAVIARGSDFFGPDVEGSVLGRRVFDAILQGGTVRAVGDIDQPHCYTYVEDFGRALAELGRTPASWGRVWHVPNTPAVSTRQLLEGAAAMAGTRPRISGSGALMLRAVGLFVPEVRETVELLSHFEHPYRVDDSLWRSRMTTRETPRELALAQTLESCRRRIARGSMPSLASRGGQA